MEPTRLQLNSHSFFVLIFWLVCPLPATAGLIVQVKNPALRARLARTYAPEIHQDREEAYGLASISYVLRRSRLQAAIAKCSQLKARRSVVTLGPGALLAAPRGRFSWHHHSGLCKRLFDAFAKKDASSGLATRLAAPNRLFLQLDDHKPTTLLKKPHKHAITPAISYRVYEQQSTSCTQRNLFFSCQSYRTRRYYVIQYFVTLMFNEACNEHEGEHEGLVVQVDANGFDWGKTQLDRYKAIEKIGLYGHYHTTLLTPSKLSFSDMTHPMVYMGKGGHALYAETGSEDLLMGFDMELRRVMKRTCRKRKRLPRLTEHHRGGGAVYKTWLPPKGPIANPQTKRLYLPKLKATSRHLIASQPALQSSCLLARKQRGVRLCDVMPGAHNDPCCLKGQVKGLVPWVQFTGRWGKQESFVSSLTGAAAVQVGRFFRRWPLARSMGNSGPFGPQWIHASTWRWRNPKAKPATTSSLWR